MQKIMGFALALTLASAFANAQAGLPPIVLDAANGKIDGCAVKLWVEGWANQLYVRDVFSGNFGEDESQALAEKIQQHVDTGRCFYLACAGKPSTTNLPPEILAAERGDYPLIKVLPWVSGWANQLYINSVFLGNFDESQSADLVGILKANDVRKFPRVVRDAEAGLIEGCEVKFLVTGWANQLYLRGNFSGNYGVSEIENLGRIIQEHLSTGRCNYKTLTRSKPGCGCGENRSPDLRQ